MTISPTETLTAFHDTLSAIEKSTQSNDKKVKQLDRLFEALVLQRSTFDRFFDIGGVGESFVEHYEKVANQLYGKLGTLATVRFAHLSTKADTVKIKENEVNKVPFRFSLTAQAIQKVAAVVQMSDSGVLDMTEEFIGAFAHIRSSHPSSIYAPAMGAPIRFLPPTPPPEATPPTIRSSAELTFEEWSSRLPLPPK